MSREWLRLYAEFAYDPKVQVLTEALQRRYVMLLCLHSAGHFQNRPDDEIALSLRVTVEEWQFTKQEFFKRGLLTKEGNINGWEKRQYLSDLKDQSAAERQKRYRDKKRNDRNDTVTSRLPEQKQSRAEADKKDKASIEIVDRSSVTQTLPEDLNLNDFACACAVLAELLGKKQLARQDQETVGFWCATYDMRGEALPLIGKKFKQYFSKNGEPPKSLKYFNNMLAEGCKKQPPHMELGKKLRTV